MASIHVGGNPAEEDHEGVAFTHEGVLYRVGDWVALNNSSDRPWVGKILDYKRLPTEVQISGSDEAVYDTVQLLMLPQIKCQWGWYPDELKNEVISEINVDDYSRFEIIPAEDFIDWNLVGSIKHKIKVLPYSKFMQLSSFPEITKSDGTTFYDTLFYRQVAFNNCRLRPCLPLEIVALKCSENNERFAYFFKARNPDFIYSYCQGCRLTFDLTTFTDSPKHNLSIVIAGCSTTEPNTLVQSSKQKVRKTAPCVPDDVILCHWCATKTPKPFSLLEKINNYEQSYGDDSFDTGTLVDALNQDFDDSKKKSNKNDSSPRQSFKNSTARNSSENKHSSRSGIKRTVTRKDLKGFENHLRRKKIEPDIKESNYLPKEEKETTLRLKDEEKKRKEIFMLIFKNLACQELNLKIPSNWEEEFDYLLGNKETQNSKDIFIDNSTNDDKKGNNDDEPVESNIIDKLAFKSLEQLGSAFNYCFDKYVCRKTNDKRFVKQRFFEITQNLKRTNNRWLRKAVLTGEVTVKYLVTAKVEKLAPIEVQKMRQIERAKYFTQQILITSDQPLQPKHHFFGVTNKNNQTSVAIPFVKSNEISGGNLPVDAVVKDNENYKAPFEVSEVTKTQRSINSEQSKDVPHKYSLLTNQTITSPLLNNRETSTDIESELLNREITRQRRREKRRLLIRTRKDFILTLWNTNVSREKITDICPSFLKEKAYLKTKYESMTNKPVCLTNMSNCCNISKFDSAKHLILNTDSGSLNETLSYNNEMINDGSSFETYSVEKNCRKQETDWFKTPYHNNEVEYTNRDVSYRLNTAQNRCDEENSSTINGCEEQSWNTNKMVEINKMSYEEKSPVVTSNQKDNFEKEDHVIISCKIENLINTGNLSKLDEKRTFFYNEGDMVLKAIAPFECLTFDFFRFLTLEPTENLKDFFLAFSKKGKTDPKNDTVSGNQILELKINKSSNSTNSDTSETDDDSTNTTSMSSSSENDERSTSSNHAQDDSQHLNQCFNSKKNEQEPVFSQVSENQKSDEPSSNSLHRMITRRKLQINEGRSIKNGSVLKAAVAAVKKRYGWLSDDSSSSGSAPDVNLTNKKKKDDDDDEENLLDIEAESSETGESSENVCSSEVSLRFSDLPILQHTFGFGSLYSELDQDLEEIFETGEFQRSNYSRGSPPIFISLRELMPIPSSATNHFDLPTVFDILIQKIMHLLDIFQIQENDLENTNGCNEITFEKKNCIQKVSQLLDILNRKKNSLSSRVDDSYLYDIPYSCHLKNYIDNKFKILHQQPLSIVLFGNITCVMEGLYS